MEVNYIKYWRKSSLKKKKDGNFLLNHIRLKKPKNFLEIGVFHGVTSRNVCELLYSFHGNDFKFTGIDLFVNDETLLKDEYIPKIKFSNPLKTIYYKYIIRLDPYSVDSILRLLKKFQKNVNIIKGNSNKVLKEINVDKFDYVFLDGGHKYETVKKDLENLTQIVNNNGTILCDDYDLSYAPGVKKAIEDFVSEKNFNLKILNSRFAEITKR
jgi:predicted O-methyltransferase YrrM|tara:strand:- start:290 stop:925 length:636 start_codon:yes stop_codon:yes gene_type:complete